MNTRILALILGAATIATSAVAGAPGAGSLAFQGFETKTGDWTDITGIPGAGITRVPTGGGVLKLPSATGNYHAEITNEHDTYQAGFGYGDYSFFGFATSPPYPGYFSQSISMYIFANWAPAIYNGPGVWIDMQPGNPDPNNSGAEHNFRLTPTGSSVMVTVDGQLAPIATITTSGWYKFQMTYQKGANPTDLVSTNMNVFSANQNLVGTTTVVSNSVSMDGPLLSENLLGPGYVWITVWPNGWASDVLAIDDVRADAFTADDCKDGGRQSFTTAPGSFKNQGQCVSHFASNGNH